MARSAVASIRPRSNVLWSMPTGPSTSSLITWASGFPYTFSRMYPARSMPRFEYAYPLPTGKRSQVSEMLLTCSSKVPGSIS